MVQRIIFALFFTCALFGATSLPEATNTEVNATAMSDVQIKQAQEEYQKKIEAERKKAEQEARRLEEERKEAEAKAKEIAKEQKRQEDVKENIEYLNKLEQSLLNVSIVGSYHNHLSYIELSKEYDELLAKIKKAKKRRKDIGQLEDEQKILEDKLELYKIYRESPILNLLNSEEFIKMVEVKNPFDILQGFTYIKQVKEQKKVFKESKKELEDSLKLLEEKKVTLLRLFLLTKSDTYEKEANVLQKPIDDFSLALKSFDESYKIYLKEIETDEQKVKEGIKAQIQKAGTIGGIILFLIIFNLFLKYIIKKYIVDNERSYMANKVINFTFAIIVIFVLLFSYLENVKYLVTILGFASAGIAIALKDMFMSLIGWLVIVIGGSMHVGDRIKVTKHGLVYVGDIIDISLLRVTILEDVTLTSYTDNKRSGRVIFIPNNYVFTDLIANYTHSGIKTVWDVIEIPITFESNSKKATQIAKDVARKYSKGYTDITRKQLNKLRTTYHLKNVNVDVRVFAFIEPYGMNVNVWYLTNSYGTLTLKSTISHEIVELFKRESDIEITYPSQNLYVEKRRERVVEEESLL